MNRKIIGLVATFALVGSLAACSNTPKAGSQQAAPTPSTSSTPDAMKKDGDAMKKDGDAMKQGDTMKKDGDAMKKETPTKP